MKDKELHESIKNIKSQISLAELIRSDKSLKFNWRPDFLLKQAEIEALLLLARVIQERPINNIQ